MKKSAASNYVLVFITASSLQEAEQLGTMLVEKRLAACGNIIRDVRSIFWWKDTIETQQEVLLMVKSRAMLFPHIVNAVTSLHSYDVPEVIAVPIISGSEPYLTWIDEETKESQE